MAPITRDSSAPLRTFSIAFNDAAYDESAFQREVVSGLGTGQDYRFIEVRRARSSELRGVSGMARRRRGGEVYDFLGEPLAVRLAFAELARIAESL